MIQGAHRAFAGEENALGAAAAHARDAAEAEAVNVRLKSKFRGVQVTLMTGGEERRGGCVGKTMLGANEKRRAGAKGTAFVRRSCRCGGGLGRRSYTDVGPQRQGGGRGREASTPLNAVAPPSLATIPSVQPCANCIALQRA